MIKKINPKLANALGIVTIISWGSLGLLGSEAASLPPLFVLAFCFWGATLIGLVIVLIRVKSGAPLPSVSLNNAVLGGTFLFGYHYLYFSAFHFAPAIEVSLLNYLWPAFVIIIGNLFFSLKSGIRGVIAALIGFSGIVVLFGSNVAAFSQPDYLFGFALALAGAIVWATYSNLRRNSSGDVVFMVTAICAIAASLATGFSWMLEDQSYPTNTQLVTLILLTIGPAGGAFFLWDVALKHGNAAMLAVFGYAAPLISTGLLIASGLADLSLRIVLATLLIAAGGLFTIKLPRLFKSKKATKVTN